MIFHVPNVYGFAGYGGKGLIEQGAPYGDSPASQLQTNALAPRRIELPNTDPDIIVIVD
jgi:hypothetical protein